MDETARSTTSSENDRGPCNPRHPLHRFIALMLMCFLCFGSYFCYDTPGALANYFKKDSHLNTSQFAWLYSIYSWPNVVLCFIGGYLIDSIGGESLQVAANNYVVLWFKGKELNMVFGLQLSFARFGSAVNFWVMEPVYKWVGQYYHGYKQLGVALFLASLTCLGSLICGIILGWMDYYSEKLLGRQEQRANEEPFKLRDILKFKSVFWLVTVICVAYYLAIFPFIALGKLFFERKFDYVPQDANTVNSMVYLLSAILSPFCGILIDKTGRNITWVIVSIIATIGAHLILAFTFFNPYIGVISLGFSYSLLAAGLWPIVALIVQENQLGTAYGMTCDETSNLLSNEEEAREPGDRSTTETDSSQADAAQVQSDRIRSRYLAQILPNSIVSDRP
ncbi:Major facilitator superfamily domain-containing protein 1 [Eumeta japonica]|uniref:Lysosomal dipeptide transporter MFSD1 n=1 Tax=Eumeta variegata TaxID=151549 RepID=A0A4C1XAQ0_EUMVA|nr:Major facilitator superfamily domain-containing protein 1 [Eumeta japonica]